MKKWLALTLLFLSTSAFAGDQLFSFHPNGNFVNSAPRYCDFNGLDDTTATETDIQVAVPSAKTFSKLYFSVVTAPGAGKSWVLTLRKNATDTTVTCTIQNFMTNCLDYSHSVDFAAGDLLSFKITPAFSPTATTGAFNYISTSATSGVSWTASWITGISAISTEYASIHGNDSATTTRDEYFIIPKSGMSITNLYIKGSDPGAAPNTLTFTIEKNGGTDTTLSCALSEGVTSCTDSEVVAVSSQDYLVVQTDPVSSPTTGTTRVSMDIIAPNDGEFIIPADNLSGIDANGTSYNMLYAHGLGPTGTESDLIAGNLVKDVVFSNLSLRSDVSLGSGSYDYTIRKYNSADTAVTCHQAGAATCTDATHTVTISDTTGMDMKMVGTSAGSSFTSWWFSVLGYINPTTTPTTPQAMSMQGATLN